jgi:hypothetical protein
MMEISRLGHRPERVMVEVQWGERKNFSLTLDFEPFWKRLGKYSFQGTMVLTFSPIRRPYPTPYTL